MRLKSKLMQDMKNFKASGLQPKYLVIAVELPTGATELITNTEAIEQKVEYYDTAYDDNFRLKTNSTVRVVGYMLV